MNINMKYLIDIITIVSLSTITIFELFRPEGFIGISVILWMAYAIYKLIQTI